MAAAGGDDNVSRGQDIETSWPVERSARCQQAGGLDSGLVQWEIRLEGKVKIRTCKIH